MGTRLMLGLVQWFGTAGVPSCITSRTQQDTSLYLSSFDIGKAFERRQEAVGNRLPGYISHFSR